MDRKDRLRVGHVLWAAVVGAALVGFAAPAGAASGTCRARDVTQDTPSSSHLQSVITAASPGDSIAVKFVCVGHFTIDKKLTLLGKATPDVAKPVLRSDHQRGSVLSTAFLHHPVAVTLTNLAIIGGRAVDGGGIYNSVNLTLNNTVVRQNRSGFSGGGIFNWGYGVVRLNGSSSVRDNSAPFGGGMVSRGIAVILNDTSSVTGNRGNGGGGILVRFGTLTMNDSSTVNGNTARSYGGGIYYEAHALTMNDSASVTGNRADENDDGYGEGGGIYDTCITVHPMTGAMAGVNVSNNYLGSTGTHEDDIVAPSC